MPRKTAMQRVQPPAGKVHILGLPCLVEPRQLPRQFRRVGGLYACLAASLEKALQPLVAE